jgi:plastocyanin
MIAASCSGAATPTVFVDYSHDEFSSQFIAYFPSEVKVHPGDTVTFRQTWTGEPHTVTLGGLADEVLSVVGPLLDEYEDVPEEDVPAEAFQAYEEAMSTVPIFWDEETGAVNQTVAQPCYAAADEIPTDGTPCATTKAPVFDGSIDFFNSGVIPFDGAGQNRFELELSPDIAPGTYGFFCIVHGPFQRGTIEVVPLDQEIPEPRDVTLQALREVNNEAEGMLEAFERARDEGVFVAAGSQFQGNFAGLITGAEASGQINEFLPRDIDAQVGEPITWLMFSGHSIAFDVPEYYPIVEFGDDGTVNVNEEIHEPAGGSPPLPEEEPEGPLVIDGGAWDGSGFFSSGTLWSPEHVEYTLRISEPGTYAYACLIHPPMVGTVRVHE